MSRRIIPPAQPNALASPGKRSDPQVRARRAGVFIAIDGKTLRRSYQEGGAKAPIHVVSAWSAKQSLVPPGTTTSWLA